MNEQTAKLLEQLANKLGTTSEHLWGVLLKQAPINSTILLFQLSVILLTTIVLWGAYKKLSSKWKSNDSCYEEPEIAAVISVIMRFIAWAPILIIFLANFGQIIAGYFNPEYWALNKIAALITKN